MRYEYKCRDCKHKFEVSISIKDWNVLIYCPKCRSENTYRLISKPAIIFKGDGFYVTDAEKKANGNSPWNKSALDKKK
jgi:putative FmdB family regulatory protein